MNLKGHSKFNLELIKNKEGYFVKKSNGKRLNKQCVKQSQFHDLIDSHSVLSHLFEVPKVETKKWDGDHFSFIMKFYNGKSILDILEKGDITLLDDLIDKLFLYLQWEFNNSSLKSVNWCIVGKLYQIHKKINDYKLKTICLDLIQIYGSKDNDITIPVGLCHGDFTFSNMIFSHKVVLIDFLDSFIASPLQDCAKILQSVNLQWELLMDDGKGRDLTKIKIGYEYLRWQITQKMINTFPNYAQMIDIFYIITLLRVIPYTTDKVIYNTVVQELGENKVMKTYNFSKKRLKRLYTNEEKSSITIAKQLKRRASCKKILIIPCAGSSSRFKGTRPKFLLTHPNGSLMISEAIKGMQPEQYDMVVIVVLREHFNKYMFHKALINELKTFILNPQIVIIESSKNQPDTIYQGIKQLGDVSGQITIKDCDNYFNLPVMAGNSVAVCDINETNTPANKSYVQLGESNSIVNIVEKQVISNRFCCGAYCFEDVDNFMSTYEKLQDNDNLYVSHIIYQMILDGKLFFTNKATNYEDWGTLESWLAYKAQFKTLFIDLDGVLVKSSSKHFAPIWGTTDAIQKNVNVVNKLYNTGKVTIIITTARSDDFKQATLHQIKRIGLNYHKLLMDIPHAQRLLINDFAQTAPYPTAIAINLTRNADNLDQTLDN